MTARRVQGWKPGDRLPAPGTIVGDISLHAPGVKFGVVTAPESSPRVERISSDDPAVWKPAVQETAEAVWSRGQQRAITQLEADQLKRWGSFLVRGHTDLLTQEEREAGRESLTLREVYERHTPKSVGLAILDIVEDDEVGQRKAAVLGAPGVDRDALLASIRTPQTRDTVDQMQHWSMTLNRRQDNTEGR